MRNGLTEHEDTATFRLAGRWQVALFAIAMLPFCAKMLMAVHFGIFLSFYVIEATAMALLWALTLRLCTVQLRADGITIQRLWWLPWTDVSAVAYRKLFGLPYFQVKRRRGFSWWIPLYYVGDRDLGSAIVRAAPSDHPFRLVSLPPAPTVHG